MGENWLNNVLGRSNHHFSPLTWCPSSSPYTMLRISLKSDVSAVYMSLNSIAKVKKNVTMSPHDTKSISWGLVIVMFLSDVLRKRLKGIILNVKSAQYEKVAPNVMGVLSHTPLMS